MSGQLHVPAALPPEKDSSLHKGPGGAQSQSGPCGVEKSYLPFPGIAPILLGRPIRSLVALPTELSRLLRKVLQY
jgi:hypothetical protein